MIGFVLFFFYTGNRQIFIFTTASILDILCCRSRHLHFAARYSGHTVPPRPFIVSLKVHVPHRLELVSSPPTISKPRSQEHLHDSTTPPPDRPPASTPVVFYLLDSATAIIDHSSQT